MANINGVGSSSYSSSIYGARGANILSGLASGLDTESMIENSVKGYKLKIQNLMNQQTKLGWKQDAYRGVADKLIALREKYTSYASKTNLSSNSFFNNAVNTTTNGKNADKISATGKTSNSIRVNGVKQIATAAKYTVSADALGLQNMGSLTGRTINWNRPDVDVSDVTGSMTIRVGGSSNSTSVSLSFTEEDLEALKNGGKAESLAALINDKLKDTTVGNNKGSDYLKAEVKDGAVVFKAGDAAKTGDGVWISSASGSMVETLGIETSGSLPGADAAKYRTLSVEKDFSHKVSMSESLSGKEFSVTLDGVTKKITLGDYGKNVSGDTLKNLVMKDLEDGLKENFGSKVSVGLTADNKLSFSTSSQNSILKVTSTTGSTLGVGSGLTNYMDTGRTLGQLLGDKMDRLKALEAVGEVKASDEDPAKGTDKAGNSVMQGDDGKWYRVDKDGKRLYGLEINGKTVGTFTEDSALDTVMTSINNSEAGVSVNYAKISNTFTFAAKETGSDSRIEFGEGLAATLFGQTGTNVGENGLLVDDNGNQVSGIDDQGNIYYVRKLTNGSYIRADEGGLPILGEDGYTKVDPSDPVIQKARKGYTAGQDAVLNVTIDGVNKTLTRSSNVVNLEGLNVTLKGAFNEGAFKASETASGYFKDTLDGIEAGSEVTFTTKADADTIVDAIKSFVEDVNNIMKETHEAYSTKPSGTYEPLSDEDRADMSETEIKNYEEKAKTGLLFADRDMSRLYSNLRSVISSSGMDVGVLRDMGITTTYSDGVTTLSLNEDKLRDALESNPDTVRNAFTKTVENGAGSNGLMYNIKKLTDTYASTSIGNYGILVKKAGTRTKSQSLTDNTLQKQIDRMDREIENWKLKMSDKIDYYTTQFTRLEQLMNQMNSQSSALSGLMGG